MNDVVTIEKPKDEVVVDVARTRLSDLWKKEDYWAIWLGMIILAVGLSMVFTAVMMVLMPMFIKAVGMPEVLGGAWIGGTIDSTGAVAAAGAFLGEKALYVAATVKMIQNILIGVVAFCVALYWCARVECAPGQKAHWTEVWHRFPKFVLGFIAASIIFSLTDALLGKDVSSVVLDTASCGAGRGFCVNGFSPWHSPPSV